MISLGNQHTRLSVNVNGRSLMATKIPVIMYHALEDELHPSGALDLGSRLYVLQVKHFQEQMEYLHLGGYRTFLLSELVAMQKWPPKAVVLTFDDGHQSNYTLAMPILQSYGFRANFFVTTGWIGKKNYMEAEQIRNLHGLGMEIGSHGVTHHFLPDLSRIACKDELQQSARTLQEIIGEDIRSFSSPGGRIDNNVKSMLEEVGFKIGCSSSVGIYKKSTPSLAIPRICITSSCSMETFQQLILLKAQILGPMIFRNGMLAICKKILGNYAYEYIRRVILENKTFQIWSQRDGNAHEK